MGKTRCDELANFLDWQSMNAFVRRDETVAHDPRYFDRGLTGCAGPGTRLGW